MKRVKLFLVSAIAMVAMVSCGGSSADAVAEKYLESIYTQDVDGFMECIDVTGEDADEVKAVVADKGMSMIKDQTSKFGSYEGVTVTNFITEEDGSAAQVDFEVKFSEAETQPATVILVMTDNGWKVPNPFKN